MSNQTSQEVNGEIELLPGEIQALQALGRHLAMEMMYGKPAAVPCKPKKQQYVYVMALFADDGRLLPTVKIGISNRPTTRANQVHGRRQLHGRSEGRPHVVFAMPAADARAVERRAHAVLEDNALGSEWFDCDVETAIKVVTQAAGA